MTPIRTWHMRTARESLLNDEELCPEYIAAIVGVVQSNVCITIVCVCQTTAYTDDTPVSGTADCHTTSIEEIKLSNSDTHMHARTHPHTKTKAK